MNNLVAFKANDEMRDMFQEIMQQTGAIGVKAGLNNIARKTGISYTRARDIWHKRAVIKVQEYQATKQALTKKEATHDDTLLQRLDRIESLLGALVSGDADFHSETINSYRSLVARARSINSSRG